MTTHQQQSDATATTTSAAAAEQQERSRQCDVELTDLRRRNAELTQQLQQWTLASAARGDVQKLESDVRTLRLEKQQMMQVRAVCFSVA